MSDQPEEKAEIVPVPLSAEELRRLRMERFGSIPVSPSTPKELPPPKRVEPTPPPQVPVPSPSPSGRLVAAKHPVASPFVENPTKKQREHMLPWATHLLNIFSLEHSMADLTLEGLQQDNLVEHKLLAHLAQPGALSYLVTAFTQMAELPTKDDAKDVLVYSQDLVINYTKLLLLNPAHFPNYTRGTITPEIVKLSKLVNFGFWSRVVPSMDEHELKEVFLPCFIEISRDLRRTRFDSPSVLELLEYYDCLLQNRGLLDLFVRNSTWKPGTSGRQLERYSLLGPLFSMTTYPAEQALKERYTALKGAPVDDWQAQIDLDRRSLTLIQSAVQKLLLKLIRNSPYFKEEFLAWIAELANLGQERTRMNPDIRLVSSDEFFNNVCAVLLLFCRPFLQDSSKWQHINAAYYAGERRINLSRDTLLGASAEEHQRYLKTLSTEPTHFISECFFLTLRTLHVGYMVSCNRYRQLLRMIQDYKKQAEQAPEASSKLQEQVDQMIADKAAIEAHLLEPALLTDVTQFYNLAMQWLVGLVVTDKEAYANLPEHIIDNAMEFFVLFNQIEQNNPPTHAQVSTLLEFIATFLANGSISNFYLRSKLVEAFVQVIKRDTKPILSTDAVIYTQLVPGLLRLFVDIEHTGASTQFYDKFNVRYWIALALKIVWPFQPHQIAVIEESKKPESFAKFINMLLNDSIYLLDESLTKLTELYQAEENMPNWTRLPADQRREKEEFYVRTQRAVKSYLLLSIENLDMLRYLTERIPDAFLVPQIIDRIAAMLGYFLMQLVGPKSAQLAVRNRQKYHFEPKDLLAKIVDIYLHLQHSAAFREAVAGDRRSYSPEVFKTAYDILSSRAARSPTQLERFEQFSRAVAECAQQTDSWEEKLGEIPDEFLDPLLMTLMIDPVLLPTSRNICDRGVIERHLLSDETDPFNRAKLTVDMLQPADELRQQIAAFVKEKTGRELHELARK